MEINNPFLELLNSVGALDGAIRDLKEREKYYPKRILKSGPCTIVFWQDGTKTMVRRAMDEVDDDYSAFTAALAIKIFGSNSAVKRTVKSKLVEQIKKPKNRKAATEEEIAEHVKWLFDKIMTFSVTAWTCPNCNIKVPYEIIDNEVVAVCPNCGLSQKLSVE